MAKPKMYGLGKAYTPNNKRDGGKKPRQNFRKKGKVKK